MIQRNRVRFALSAARCGRRQTGRPSGDRGRERRRTIFSAWEIRTKWLAALSWLIAMLFIRHLLLLMMMTAGLAGLMALDPGLSVVRLFRRLWKLLPFLLMMLLTLSLSDGFPPREAALQFAVCFCGRVVLGAVVVTALLGGQPTSVCVRGLAALPISDTYLSILFLTDRYIHLLSKAVKTQWEALRARMFVPKVRPAVLKNTGYVLGGLFIHAYDRSQQIYEGMRARCYVGQIYRESPAPPSLRDGLKTGGSLLLLGLVLYVDRMVLPNGWI